MSERLNDIIQATVNQHSSIPFSQFMQLALYHPEHGYYASQQTRVGKDGDFFTSVSVGSVFGTVLAHRIDALTSDWGTSVNLIELGANDGSLAHDILSELQSTNPEITFHYHIVEPLEHLKSKQQEKLESFTYHHYASIDELPSMQAVILSNELIDAFPVEQVQFESGEWKQLHLEGTPFAPQWKTIDCPKIKEWTNSLGNDFPSPYQTEYRDLIPFLTSLSAKITKGVMITIDYGFPRSHYYHKDRKEGNIQCYYKHEKDDNPFELPGEKDITSHVDFTQLTQEAIELDWELFDFSPQHRYLTNHGKSWLTAIEATFSPSVIPLVKQFQTLTHPGMLGRSFQVLEMTKDIKLNTPLTEKPHEVLEIM